jgi:tetratricopeptide (TPR) repeat protein
MVLRAKVAPRELQHQAVAALQAGRLAEAERCYRDLLAVYPHPGVFHNLGLVLVRLRRDVEAVPLFEQALAMRPADSNARIALSNALIHSGRPLDAVGRCDEVLAVDPANRDARVNRAVALRALNRHAEAADMLQALLADDPADADAEFNLALAELMLERYASAWKHYEARWRGSAAQLPLPQSAIPIHRSGESLAGRVVLVQAEQGLGDSLQFLRLVPLLDPICMRVDLQLQPEFVALLRRQWPARRIEALGAAPLADVERRLPLLSVPLALNMTDIGHADAYLDADPARIERWTRALQPRSASRIGVAWRGNPAKRNAAQIAIPLQALQPWFAATARGGYSVVALQRDASPQEHQWLAGFQHVEVLGTRLNDFDDTAAVMALTDQIVSVDTSVIHLAGALGRPGAVLLQFCSDWRWGVDRPDGATYRSVRALRQHAPGQWDSVVSALVGLLP